MVALLLETKASVEQVCQKQPHLPAEQQTRFEQLSKALSNEIGNFILRKPAYLNMLTMRIKIADEAKAINSELKKLIHRAILNPGQWLL